MKLNFKAPLYLSLIAAGFSPTGNFGSRRPVFVDKRKNGTRRVKLWFADDVFKSTRRRQLKLEAALKRNYGDKYRGGYFIKTTTRWGGEKSLCIELAAGS